MSGSSITDSAFLPSRLAQPGLSRLFFRPIKRLAFWSAVVLPFMHLSLLATGLDSQSKTLAFVALVAANVVALYLGHPYGRE